MISRSYTNLLDLTTSYSLALSPKRKGFSKVMALPAVLSDTSDGNTASYSGTQSPLLSSPRVSPQDRIIIVSNMLPVHARKDETTGSWSFSWDENSLYRQLKDGLPKTSELLYIGCLDADIEFAQQEEIAATLLEELNCLPVYVPTDLKRNYLNGFCQHQIWPLFHYMLPMTSEHGSRFDRTLWQAYVSVNKMFADKLMEVINPEDDFVWVHDYHLMALPTFLRKRFYKVKLGFFLHIPFPSSEIFRTLPVREEILRGLLNADLIGFHTFDYARHFLSCCSRMLGLKFKTKRGYIGLEYFGRTVGIKIMPVGIHLDRLMGTLQMAETKAKIRELKAEFEGKVVILGMDELDIFQGINLKLLAMEQLLIQNPSWRRRLVLVQIANPTERNETFEIHKEIYATLRRINEKFGTADYKPVVFIERPVSHIERSAYYTIAECCVVTAVRDGLNLIPYEYTACRQGSDLEKDTFNGDCFHRQSALVISEFIGCSPSLSGALRVNPWNINDVAEAILSAVTMAAPEKELRHEKHHRYVSTHGVAYWVRSFMADLERTCKDHAQHRCWGIGFGFGFRIVALDPSFRKLSVEHITSAYKRTKNRVILLDYDGTMVPCNAIDKTPTSQIISVLNALCDDPNNLVCIVSGRSRNILQNWFSPCNLLGLSAEHGYFNRWQQEGNWECPIRASDFSWKEVVEPVLRRYTESTDGSSLEAKESALVWHYQDADPDFGSWQAKELLDHLESMLTNKPVSVKSGHHIIEVKPQGVSKGIVAEELLFSMVKQGKSPEFVLCIGDDRSDEDMFESIAHALKGIPQTPLAEVFACTVGQKPSKAKYYLNDTVEVVTMLQALTTPDPESFNTSLHSDVALHRTKFC